MRLLPLCVLALSVGAFVVGCEPKTGSTGDDGGPDSMTDAGNGSGTDGGPGMTDGGSSGTDAGSTPLMPGEEAGLLFPDGIEPGDPSVCEAPAPHRCWWVDSAAPNGGDGSFAQPFNSFEAVAGTDVGDGYVPGLLEGGDFLYVRGTFDGSQSTDARRLIIELARTQQCGTKAEPTTIKSWRGSIHALLDGALVANDLISIRNCDAVKIQNIELAHHGGRGVYIGENVAFAELASLYVHDGIGDGNSGIGGGIFVTVTDANTHEFLIHHNRLSNNRLNPTGVDGNIGAISVLMEPTTMTPGVVRIYDNVIEHEVTAIRQKHTGYLHLEGYDNFISDCTTALAIRAYENDYHHNVVVGCRFGMAQDSWNYQVPSFTATVHQNTFYEVPTLLTMSMEYPDSPGYDVVRNYDLRDNIVANVTPQQAAMIEYNDIPGALVHTNIHTEHNLYWYAPQDAAFVTSPTQNPTDIDYGTAMQNYGDVGSFFADPLFTDAANGDFTLKTGSPAIGAGTMGVNIGAK